ncbi:MAG: TonB-dependent receptor [Bacteroidales bacterium]|nr:TonB-dependent receptor [Bacteroidales bacterium]
MTKFSLSLCLLLLMSVSAIAQNIKVNGSIKDEKGEPIVGAYVFVQGTSTGVNTDANGNYTISVAKGQTIVCQSLGYTVEKVVVSNSASINFILKEEASLLSQVVVLGYGSIKKSDLTGSVASVKSDIVNRQPIPSFEKSLQGRVAGVQVSTDTSPGGGATIRIRGGSSIYSDNSPLLVVDGFPLGSAGGLKQISPDEIERIDILKDASASAIYGSRGANGVIIVTTKKAIEGTTRVTVSNQTTFNQLSAKLDRWENLLLMAQLSNEASINAGLNPRYIGKTDASGIYYPSLGDISTGAWPYNTNWEDLVYRSVPVTNDLNVSISGSNAKTQYNLGVSYLYEQGKSIKDDYKKGNVNFSLQHKINNSITIKFSEILSKDYRYNNSLWLRNPIFPAFNEDGSYYMLNSVDYSHPIAVSDNSYNYSNGFDSITMLGVESDITDWLKFTAQASYKYGNSINDYFQPAKYTSEGNLRNGYGKISNWNGQNAAIDAYLTFNKTFGDIHNINAMVGYSYEYGTARSSALASEDFIDSALGNENLGSGKAEKMRVSNSLSESELVSTMFRANYSLMDKYLFTVTARMDGSSKFGADNKFAFFPSGAVSWKAHNEDFIKNMELFDELKFRLSYGTSGNQGISAYQTLPRYGQQLYYYNNEWTNAIGQGFVAAWTGPNGRIRLFEGLGAPSLRWETTTQTNFGVDLGMLDNRIRLTFDIYNKRTDNLLRDGYLPPSSAFDRKKINGGTVLNKGFEITLGGDIKRSKDFNISATAIFTLNRNRLQSLGDVTSVGFNVDPKDNMAYQYWGSVPSVYRESGVNILAIGKPVNVFYGFKTDGIVQSLAEGLEAGLSGDMAKPGEIKYVDYDKSGVFDDGDKTIIGDPNPDFLASLTLNMSWRNFEAELFFNGSYGNDVINTQKFGTPKTMPLRWTPDNPNNDYPSLRESRYEYRFSDFWVEDGSYLKLQNLNISYNIDFKTKKYVLTGVKINLNATNLFTISKFSGYDPQKAGMNGIYGGGLPSYRLYTLGLNLKF